MFEIRDARAKSVPVWIKDWQNERKLIKIGIDVR
jgi:hypothetical protein